MRKPFVTIDGVKVFRTYNAKWAGRDGVGVKYCAVCENEINVGDEVSLLMNNNVLFPNVWVHNSHLDYDESFEDVARYNVVSAIISKYKSFVAAYEMRKIWGHI